MLVLPDRRWHHTAVPDVQRNRLLSFLEYHVCNLGVEMWKCNVRIDCFFVSRLSPLSRCIIHTYNRVHSILLCHCWTTAVMRWLDFHLQVTNVAIVCSAVCEGLRPRSTTIRRQHLPGIKRNVWTFFAHRSTAVQ